MTKFKEQQPAKFRHRLKSLPWLGRDRMEDMILKEASICNKSAVLALKSAKAADPQV